MSLSSKKKSPNVLKAEVLLVAAVVVGAGVFFLVVRKQPQYQSLLHQASEVMQPAPQEEERLDDFSNWTRQEDVESLFHFYIPGSLELKTVEEGKRLQVVAQQKPEDALIEIEHILYSDFQAQKLQLDKDGLTQFGWTNAYGSSVFEYKADTMTSFVVDKDKKNVMKLSTTNSEFFPLLENMTKTFQTTTPEEYIHGTWYVNFNGGYKIRYTTDLELPEEDAFTNHAEWISAQAGRIQLSTYDGQVLANDFYELILQAEKDTEFPNASGETVKILQEMKVDGVVANMYSTQGETGTIGVVWKKDDVYFVISADWVSNQTFTAQRNVLRSMLSSFRFLTEQESLKSHQ
jgi:hypothetical protein